MLFRSVVGADSTQVEIVTEATARNSAGLESNFDLVPIETKDEADTALILAAPITTDAFRSATADSNNEIPSLTQPDSDSLFSSSKTALAVSQPRQSSLSSSTHTCSTCHLYAPSSSVTFYLDAWLNQQNDIQPSSVSESQAKSKKRVNWPDTTVGLRNVIEVEKWIEKGIHVHPQSRPRSERYDDSEDDDDELECQQSNAFGNEEERVSLQSKEEKQIEVVPEVQVQAQPLQQKSQLSTADSDSASLGLDAAADMQRKQEMTISPIRFSPVNKVPVQVQRKMEALVVKRPSPPSSVSSSSSSSSSSSKSQQQRVMKHSKPTDPNSNHSSAPRVVTQLPAPKKKFSSGVTVKIIGGPYSEHEAAMKIRGVDPIKHRAMIENYWQY